MGYICQLPIYHKLLAFATLEDCPTKPSRCELFHAGEFLIPRQGKLDLTDTPDRRRGINFIPLANSIEQLRGNAIFNFHSLSGATCFVSIVEIPVYQNYTGKNGAPRQRRKMEIKQNGKKAKDVTQ